MSLERLATETLVEIIANLHDLGDLHALAMTSRYFCMVCLATSSAVLSRLFLNSYDYPDLILLASGKATQLSDWVLGPDVRSEHEQNERLGRITKEVINSQGPITEALSFLPITFHDLVSAWGFNNETVPRAVQCMPAIWRNEGKPQYTAAVTRYLIMLQEACYHLFYHRFEEIPAWQVTPTISQAEERSAEARLPLEIRHQFIKRFLHFPEEYDLEMVPSGKSALGLFGIQMLSGLCRTPHKPDQRYRLDERPRHRWLSHKKEFFPDHLLGFEDRLGYDSSGHGYMCLFYDWFKLLRSPRTDT